MNSESKIPAQQPRTPIGTKKKPSYKFNWFDIVVALIIIIAISCGGWFISRKNVGAGITNQTAKVTYQVEVQRVLEEIKDSPQTGDEMRDAVKRFRLGQVIHVDVTPQTELVQDKINGKIVKSISPKRYRLVLTIEADAIISDGRVTVDSLPIAVGSPMVIRTAHFSGEGYCIGLKTE